MRFNVITTYDVSEQDIIDIDLHRHHYDDEERFMKIVLDCIDVSSIMELNKISVCQHAKQFSDISNWLLERSGKYYFNYGINNDDDTKRWHDF